MNIVYFCVIIGYIINIITCMHNISIDTSIESLELTLIGVIRSKFDRFGDDIMTVLLLQSLGLTVIL